MITVKKELDFQDMLNECWSGAIWTLELIEKYEKEEELLDFLNEIYGDEILSITELNDLLWHEPDFILENLEIPEKEYK